MANQKPLVAREFANLEELNAARDRVMKSVETAYLTGDTAKINRACDRAAVVVFGRMVSTDPLTGKQKSISANRMRRDGKVRHGKNRNRVAPATRKGSVTFRGHGMSPLAREIGWLTTAKRSALTKDERVLADLLKGVTVATLTAGLIDVEGVKVSPSTIRNGFWKGQNHLRHVNVSYTFAALTATDCRKVAAISRKGRPFASQYQKGGAK